MGYKVLDYGSTLCPARPYQYGHNIEVLTSDLPSHNIHLAPLGAAHSAMSNNRTSYAKSKMIWDQHKFILLVIDDQKCRIALLLSIKTPPFFYIHTVC